MGESLKIKLADREQQWTRVWAEALGSWAVADVSREKETQAQISFSEAEVALLLAKGALKEALELSNVQQKNLDTPQTEVLPLEQQASHSGSAIDALDRLRQHGLGPRGGLMIKEKGITDAMDEPTSANPLGV